MRHFPLTADYPAILPLGMALAAVQRDWHRLDEASNAVTRSPQEMTTAGLLEDQEAALQDLIAALPAATLQDAAVQMGVACSIIGRLDASDWSAKDMHAKLDAMHADLWRIVLSVFPLIIAAAGLDPKAMCWEDYASLRASMFFGKEAGA
jgi:hypothetical protein